MLSARKALRATLTLVGTAVLVGAGFALKDPSLLETWKDVPAGVMVLVPALNFLGQTLIDYARHAKDRE